MLQRVLSAAVVAAVGMMGNAIALSIMSTAFFASVPVVPARQIAFGVRLPSA